MRSQTDRSAAPSFEEGVTFQERRTMRKLAFAVAVVMLLVCNSAYAFEQRTIEEHTIERHTYEQRSKAIRLAERGKAACPCQCLASDCQAPARDIFLLPDIVPAVPAI
jgi:hypothetical protein